MCGIVGYVGSAKLQDRSTEVLIQGLKRLEYRGYDSSGLAALGQSGQIDTRRAVGKIINLEKVLQQSALKGHIGLGHTRWATHGVPSEINAHPHTDCSKTIVVVHNGIIENYLQLRADLTKKGHQFLSQTDTEVIVHLIEEVWNNQKKSGVTLEIKNFVKTLQMVLSQLQGAWALGVLCADFPETIFASRRDCPLVIGAGEKENFLASDVTALLNYTRKTINLEVGEIAVIQEGSIQCFDEDQKLIDKKINTILWDAIAAEKSGYKHFMLKEIMEQPNAIQDTLRSRLVISKEGLQLDLKWSAQELKKIQRVKMLACGTSYHAALVGRFWIESLAGLPCDVEIASEYRYRTQLCSSQDLAVFISQSGETADTLAALRMIKKRGSSTLAICNVLGSTLTQEADSTLFTHCGPEIGVASTKAFTAQLTSLLLLALHLGIVNGKIQSDQAQDLVEQILQLPRFASKTLKCAKQMEDLAVKYEQKTHFLFLGRNVNYPIALEGALKLKEISYIHAEGYPAGEMKHGPIALIDKEMPVLSIATAGSTQEKMLSNMEEARSRGANIIALVCEGDQAISSCAQEVVFLPKVSEFLSPILNVIPLQLFAYYVAAHRGCDVDQPRNLAKSVTVE